MYTERENGTHAITCDTPSCKHEVIGVCEGDVFEDAGLEGWHHQDDHHVCPPCNRNPQKAIMQHVAPQGVVTVPATAPIQAGSPVYHQGQEIGTALGDAASGDPVEVQLNTPADPEEEHNERSQYADILDEEDDLDEEPVDAVEAATPNQPTAKQEEEADELFGFLEEGGASKTAWEPD